MKKFMYTICVQLVNQDDSDPISTVNNLFKVILTKKAYINNFSFFIQDGRFIFSLS